MSNERDTREIERGDHWQTGDVSWTQNDNPESFTPAQLPDGSIARTSIGLTGDPDPGYDPGMADPPILSMLVKKQEMFGFCFGPSWSVHKPGRSQWFRENGLAPWSPWVVLVPDTPDFAPEPVQEPRSGSGEGTDKAPTPDRGPQAAPGALLDGLGLKGDEVPGTRPGVLDFTQTMDAREWARAFATTIASNPRIPHDEGAMIGWFANAIMRGWDEAFSRLHQEIRRMSKTILVVDTPVRIPYGYGIVDRDGRPYWDDGCVCEDQGPIDDLCTNLNEYGEEDNDPRVPYRVVQLIALSTEGIGDDDSKR